MNMHQFIPVQLLFIKYGSITFNRIPTLKIGGKVILAEPYFNYCLHGITIGNE